MLSEELMAFGKLPERGDFIRVGLASAESSAFETWLGHCVERSRGAIPHEPVRFLLRFDGLPSLVGTWVKSRDRVGRAFPLAVFRSLDNALDGVPMTTLPAFFASYLAELEASLHVTEGVDVASLLSGAGHVPTPHPSELPMLSGALSQALDELSVPAFCSRVYGQSAPDQLAYALFTLDGALGMARGRSAPPPTLDCPGHDELDRFFWLSLLHAMSADDTPPLSLIWSGGRTLIMFGRPSEDALTFLVQPEHNGAQRWPLHTTRSEVATSSLAQIGPSLEAALRRGASLREVLMACPPRRSMP